jgi:Holliday junction resolvase RusA-like endonuclease
MRETFQINIKFIVLGRPVSQKNSKRVGFKKGGKGFLWTPKNIKDWKTSAIQQLADQWGDQDPIPSGVELQAEIVSFLGKGQSIDSDNLAAGPLDAMEKAGVYKNDYWVKRTISDRMKDPKNPRVVIYLKNYEEREQED